jgi:hypothetical protein
MDSKKIWTKKLSRLVRELEFFKMGLERAHQNERMSEHINYNVKRKNLCLWIVGLLMIANIAICLTQISRYTSRCEIRFPKQQILQLFFSVFSFLQLYKFYSCSCSYQKKIKKSMKRDKKIWSKKNDVVR